MTQNKESQPSWPGHIGGMPPRVLIVEENPDEAVHLAKALAGAGFAVDLATDGTEAVEVCRKRSFDAIAVDTRLVGADGWEVLQALRASACRQDTPVVLVTPHGGREEVALGIHDVLAKSAPPAELVASLERAGVTAEEAPIVLIVDDDPGVRTTLEAFLRDAGYRPVFSPDGGRALVVAAELAPAAVVLDPIAPRLDGFDFLKRLRQTGPGSRVPVILWTDVTATPQEPSPLERWAQGPGPEGPSGLGSLWRAIETTSPFRLGHAAPNEA